MKIVVPPAARLQQIEAFTRRIEDASTDEFELHLPSTYFSLHPMVLSAIVAGGLRAIAAGASVTVPNVPDSPSGRYLERMGLFELLGVPFTGAITAREETGRFVPLRVISSGVELSKFVNDLVPLFHTNPDRAQSIQYVVSELMRNVLEHSGSNSRGVVCAQLYPSGVVAIGVADTGQGIRNSLARSYATESDLHALQLAMRPGVTGTTPNIGGNMDNAGAGLFFCKALAFFSRNYFVMHSGTALFKLLIPRPQDRMALWADAARDRATRYDSINEWPGTLIGIDLNTADTRPFSELLKTIREEYGVDVRREKADSSKQRPRFT